MHNVILHLLSRATRPGELVKRYENEPPTFQSGLEHLLLFVVTSSKQLNPQRFLLGSSSHGSSGDLLIIQWRSRLPPASPWLKCQCFTPSESWSPSWSDVVAATSPRRGVPSDSSMWEPSVKGGLKIYTRASQ